MYGCLYFSTVGDYIGQCTKCKFRNNCEHKIKCESIGFEVQICKYYEVSETIKETRTFKY